MEENTSLMQLSGQIGIWTDYAPLDRGEVLDVVETVGHSEVTGVEIFAEHLAYFRDDPADLARVLDTAGLDLSGVYFNVDHRDPETYIDQAGALADTMATIGGDVLVVGAGREYEDDEERLPAAFEAMAAMLDGIAAAAADHGVDTVVHPHRGQLVETPADLEALLDAGLDRDAIGLCPHATHQYAVGADPYTIYEDYSDWVRYLHLSDATPDGDGELLDVGVLDQHRLHDPIFEAGYDGWIVVEGRTDHVSTEEYVSHVRSFVETEFLGEEGWA